MSRTIGMGTVKPIENNAEIEALQAKNDALVEENTGLKGDIAILKAENTKLIEENKVLKAENKKLKKE